MAIGGLGYIANIFASVLPHDMAVRIFPYIMLPAGAAELLLSLWLVVIGVNTAKWQKQATATGTLPSG
jgi:hypothetical protein